MVTQTQPEYVRISLTEGPVILKSGTGTGVQATYTLWDGAKASEYFPQGAGSAFYSLSLEQTVDDPAKVGSIEEILTGALRTLALAWPFAGGSHMRIDSRMVVTTTRFESNAKEVEERLLARQNRVSISSTGNFPVSACATYSRPPLQFAIEIANHSRRHFPTKQVLRYYNNAVDWRGGYSIDEGAAWFVDLYKIRDLLQNFYGNEKEARSKLGISNNDWKELGRLLNSNDLRHAELYATPPALSAGDVDRLYSAAWRWVRSFLEQQGLPVVQKSSGSE